MYRTTLNIQPYLIAAAFTAFFEIALSAFLFSIGSRALADIFITKKLQKGNYVVVGKRLSIVGLSATVIILVMNQTIAIAEIGIRPKSYGEVRWDPVLSTWQELELINQGGMITVSGSNLLEKGDAEVISTNDMCALKIRPMTVRTNPTTLKRVGDKPSKLYIRSSTTKHHIVWQNQDETIRHGTLVGQCVDINGDRTEDVTEITDKMLEDAAIEAYDPVVCVKVGEKRVYKKKSNWRKELYYNVWSDSGHIGQIISRVKIRKGDIDDLDGSAVQKMCLEELEKTRFLAEGVHEADRIWSMYREKFEPEYINLGTKTEIFFEYFIPILVACAISLLSMTFLHFSKEIYRLSASSWIAKLIIDHYEGLNSCRNPKGARKIGIIDMGTDKQHLGIVKNVHTIQPRNFNKDLR